MTSPTTRVFHQAVHNVVRRLSPTVRTDEIVSVLIAEALLVQLGSTDMEDAISCLRSAVDGIDLSWNLTNQAGS